jgi:hypothetical protein
MSTTTSRLARLAAATVCPAALVVAATPVWAGTPAPDATTQRAGTGALTGKQLSARTTLTSTSGKRLVLSVGASTASGGTTVTIGLGRGTESHVWSFKAPRSALVIGSTGAGTLKLTAAQTGDRGRLDLKFSPKDTARKRYCGGQLASRTRPMAVSGIAFFKTATAAWGTVGKSARAISLAGANNVTWTYDTECPGSTPACARTLSWSAFQSTSSATTGLSGTSNGTSASITGFRSLTLPAPAGATRMDLVTKAAPVPSFNQSGSAATLVAALGEGRLTVQGAGGFGSTYECRDGATTRTASDTSWFGSVTNGTTALRLPAQVFGAIGIADGSTGTVGRQTF